MMGCRGEHACMRLYFELFMGLDDCGPLILVTSQCLVRSVCSGVFIGRSFPLRTTVKICFSTL